MVFQKGDIVYEDPEQYGACCGARIEILDGGAGIEKIVCCGNELTEEDVINR
ncbi:MAG: hypothetical protein MAG715_01173 [Methanonatronarchaeales archaeon]|nr:hypothetical protein [Methanonatronarchaeales archaeon]